MSSTVAVIPKDFQPVLTPKCCSTLGGNLGPNQALTLSYRTCPDRTPAATVSQGMGSTGSGERGGVIVGANNTPENEERCRLTWRWKNSQARRNGFTRKETGAVLEHYKDTSYILKKYLLKELKENKRRTYT